MKRTRAYRRRIRAKQIKRKKKIVAHYPGLAPYYPDDGRYSKNKIHCSCPLCKRKAYYGGHTLTRQEQINILKFKEGISESIQMKVTCEVRE